MTAKQSTRERIFGIACSGTFEVAAVKGEKVEKGAFLCLGNVSTSSKNEYPSNKLLPRAARYVFQKMCDVSRSGYYGKVRSLAQAAHGLGRVVEVDGTVATEVGSRDQIFELDIDFPDSLSK